MTICRRQSQLSKPKSLLTLLHYSVGIRKAEQQYVKWERKATVKYSRARVYLCPTSTSNHLRWYIKAKQIKTQMKTERTARSRIFLGIKMLRSQQSRSAFGFRSCKLAEVRTPMICGNETLSVVDCNAISQNFWIYHGVNEGSQDPVELRGTVCTISGELLLIFAEPPTNFSERIIAFSKRRRIYPVPIPEQLQSVLAGKALEDLSNFSWRRVSCLLF